MSNTAPKSDDQPKSLKAKDFTSLGDFSSKVLTDDFVFGTFETYKIKGTTLKNAKFDYKAKVKLSEKDKKVTASLSDEAKIQFPFYNNKFWLWLGQRRSGDLKVHVDFGEVPVDKYKFNFFTNLKTNVDFNNLNFRIGANYFGQKCESNTRLEHGQVDDGLSLTQRTFVRSGKFLYGFVGQLVLNKLSPIKYDAVVGYETNDLDVYVQHKTQPKTGEITDNSFQVGSLIGQTVYRYKKQILAAEFERNFQDSSNKFAAVVQHEVNKDVTAKAKLDHDLNLALAAKWKVSNLLQVIASVQLPLNQKDDKKIDFSKTIPFPIGFEATLNV